MHNVEWEYYALLAKAETHFWQKLYFKWEAFLLKKFEKRIDLVDTIYTISPNDTFYFAKKHKQVAYLPAAHLFGNVEIMEGKGAFCLYHGNLAVAENHQAALFLVEKVYPLIHIPLYIAGANPRKELFEKISQYPHIQLIENPTNKGFSPTANAGIFVAKYSYVLLYICFLQFLFDVVVTNYM